MEFKRLRNHVNRERKSCRSKFYLASVHHLRQCNPSSWWSEVKKLSRMKPGSATNTELLKSLKSKAFLSPMQHFVPLPSNFSHSIVRNIETPITVTRGSIYLKLSKLNPKKAQGPDGIPSWLLKENADLLAGPITTLSIVRVVKVASPLLGKRLTWWWPFRNRNQLKISTIICVLSLLPLSYLNWRRKS